MSKKIINHLKKVDPILATVISQVPPFERRQDADFYRALVESIVSQQLSIKAADTIFARFLKLFPHVNFPMPQQVREMDIEKIRSCGISYAKISYIKDLATKTQTGILKFDVIHKLSDEEIITHLTQVKGIGRWTAEMFLMFSLGRDDVFSYGDQGLKNAIKKLYQLKSHPTLKQAEKISSKWKPYRSWACRYLWASLELE